MNLTNITILSRLRSFSIWESIILYYKKRGATTSKDLHMTPLVSVSGRGPVGKVKSPGPSLEP